jgi:primosomal replication protein N
MELKINIFSKASQGQKARYQGFISYAESQSKLMTMTIDDNGT